MKVAHEAAKIFERELNIVIEKEIAEVDFLNSKDFKTSKERAAAGVKIATEAVINFLALIDATHQEKNHEKDIVVEKTELMSVMSAEDAGVSLSVEEEDSANGHWELG